MSKQIFQIDGDDSATLENICRRFDRRIKLRRAQQYFIRLFRNASPDRQKNNKKAVMQITAFFV
jgi:hypothetical protein